jgi:hypothetical protein
LHGLEEVFKERRPGRGKENTRFLIPKESILDCTLTLFLKRPSPTDANVQRVAAVGKDFGAPETHARIYCMCSLRT